MAISSDYAHLKRTARRGVKRATRKLVAQAGGPARLQVMLLLGSVLSLDTADKAAVSAVAGSLKDAFHINNTHIGLLVACVSFVGAAFTLPFGVLVDRVHRQRLLLVAIALWTVAMVISGTATSFSYLLVTRLFLGAVTAAAAPAVASLVGGLLSAPGARTRLWHGSRRGTRWHRCGLSHLR